METLKGQRKFYPPRESALWPRAAQPGESLQNPGSPITVPADEGHHPVSVHTRQTDTPGAADEEAGQGGCMQGLMPQWQGESSMGSGWSAKNQGRCPTGLPG